MRGSARSVKMWGLTATLVGLALLAACAAPGAPAAAPRSETPLAAAPASPAASASAGGDWRAEWDRTLAAAKQEGRVVVMGPPGDGMRSALTAFQSAYPDIRLEYSGSLQQEFSPRMLAEREAGQ